MDMEKLLKLQAGDLLVAPPSLNASTFSGSVVLLCSTNPTMGLVLNHPTGTPLSRIAPDIEEYMDTEIYWGGPVNVNTIWMLHTQDWSMHNTVDINTHWSVTSNQRMFNKLAQGEWPEYWRVFAGSSVWAPGQLEQEVQQLGQGPRAQGWLTAHSPQPESVLGTDYHELWQAGCEWVKNQAVAQWF